MESISVQLPGHRINEYLLVLSPHEELARKIDSVRQEFSKQYRTATASASVQITLVRFSVWEMMEEKIAQRVQAIAAGVTPFKVEMKDYGSFPTHTIFINVTTKLPVQRLVASLKDAQRLMRMSNDNKPHFIDEPHVPLCRKLRPWQYEQGWREFSHRPFTGRFIADSLSLLKRPAGDKGRFVPVRRFEFMNQPVVSQQGSLFL